MEFSSLSCFPQEIGIFSPDAPFSDQSHTQFYGYRAFSPSSKLSFNAPSLPLAPVRSKRAMATLQAASSSSCTSCEPALEQNLMKELAELKLQMKQKKKELKARVKEKKKAMKAEEEKKKKGCSSESSSSSESSDCECESVNMKTLRQEETAEGAESEGQAAATETKMDGAEESPSRVSASAESPAAKVSNKIEVCVGGKCKRAGSEQLLLALCGQIPDASNVDAVPCKCMGKCAMGINVRVHKEATNPQHHSHAGVDDAGLILSHHFGLGRPPTGLPTFKPVVPQRLVTSSASF